MPIGRTSNRLGAQRKRGPRRQFFRRKKVCKFCVEKIDYIDYKNSRLLSSFIPERGKILPRRISGVCAPHQRKLMVALKRARTIAFLLFSTD